MKIVNLCDIIIFILECKHECLNSGNNKSFFDVFLKFYQQLGESLLIRMIIFSLS